MRSEINRYIKVWQTRCYSELPDEAPKEIDDMVPSYKSIAVSILKNDLSYIGILKPVSDYYGILKCIELGKTYKKSKRMTQSELKDFTFLLINTMIEKNCYIKGYGDKFRVCDSEHNPIKNINKQQMNVLKFNEIVVLNGLVWNLNILANPYAHAIDIRIPDKDLK